MKEEPMSGPDFIQPDLCSIRAAHGGFPHAPGYPIRQLGAGSAWLVTGRRGQRMEVAQ
jgi:hypothetical protein